MTKTIPAGLHQNYRQFKEKAASLLRNSSSRFSHWFQGNWFRLVLAGILLTVLLKKDISLQLTLRNGIKETMQGFPASVGMKGVDPPAPPHPLTTGAGDATGSVRRRQLAYITRFAPVAQAEMRKYGIPASITLGQALMETNAGASPLATQLNNHFGIKCFSDNCQKGHCRNFQDDSHKDFFRTYDTPWESYRNHSLLLQGERYRHLRRLGSKNYKAWAQGLSEAGYATDRQYAKKLIDLIQTLKLYKYDN